MKKLLILLMLLSAPLMAGQDVRPQETPDTDLGRVNAVLHYLASRRDRGAVKVENWYLLEEAGSWEHHSAEVVVPFVGARTGHPRRRHVDVTFELQRDREGALRVVKARVTRIHRPLPETQII